MIFETLKNLLESPGTNSAKTVKIKDTTAKTTFTITGVSRNAEGELLIEGALT